MAKTGAERQADYRKRHGSNGGIGRINTPVSVTAVTQLKELSKRYGVTKRGMLEKLIAAAATDDVSKTPDSKTAETTGRLLPERERAVVKKKKPKHELDENAPLLPYFLEQNSAGLEEEQGKSG